MKSLKRLLKPTPVVVEKPGSNSLDWLYPSRSEMEAAWERGEAPAYGGCQACNAVRPLELDGTCCGCGAMTALAPQFRRKVDGRWQRVEEQHAG